MNGLHGWRPSLAMDNKIVLLTAVLEDNISSSIYNEGTHPYDPKRKIFYVFFLVDGKHPRIQDAQSGTRHGVFLHQTTRCCRGWNTDGTQTMPTISL
jgi:hypothetical protein